tara:strand:- start:1805 stop:2548 length:744 start_codon:yes stop_codon:yes gene_type:complete
MAKPQPENGHTRIANEILEHLMRTHLSSNQWQVLLCIIRKTYGFQKKVDYIANKQIGEATGLGKQVVSRILKKLQGWNIITRNKKYIGLQKDWEQWKLAELVTLGTKLANQSTSKVSSIANQSKLNSLPKLAEQSTKVSSPEDTQKKKETIQKKLYKRKGEFQNVLLTDADYQKLILKLGETKVKEWIEELSIGIESKGYKFQSHYATILSWVRKEEKKGGQSGTHRQSSRRLPKIYRTPKEIFGDS